MKARIWVRCGCSRPASSIILIVAINPFLPSGMLVDAMHVDAPWFNLTRVVFTGIAAFNLYSLERLPPKTQLRDEKRPIG